MIQIQIPALQLAYRAPTMANAPTSFSSHYDEFTTRKSHPTVETPPSYQLNCDNHPFLANLLDMSDELKAFCNRVLANEGDIFENYVISRIQ